MSGGGDLFSPLPWWERPFAALDFEATATDPFTARPVSFAAVIVELRGGLRHVRSGLIKCGVDVPAESTAVHGVTREDCDALGWEPTLALRAIVDMMHECLREQMPLCIMNARYDWTLFREECRRQGIPEFVRTPDLLDPGLLDKGVDKYRKGKRKLSDLCAHYGVQLGDAHTAIADAVAAAKLARQIIMMTGRLRNVTNAGALRDWQGHVFEEYRRFLSSRYRIEPGWPEIERPSAEYWKANYQGGFEPPREPGT